MGDAMVPWTNGILRSSMHRVSHPPGKQGDSVRYSVAYFARPEKTSLMAPLGLSELIGRYRGDVDGVGKRGAITAEEWEAQKGLSLRFGVNKPQGSGGRNVLVA